VWSGIIPKCWMVGKWSYTTSLKCTQTTGSSWLGGGEADAAQCKQDRTVHAVVDIYCAACMPKWPSPSSCAVSHLHVESNHRRLALVLGFIAHAVARERSVMNVRKDSWMGRRETVTTQRHVARRSLPHEHARAEQPRR
jgi:hypothetical protein